MLKKYGKKFFKTMGILMLILLLIVVGVVLFLPTILKKVDVQYTQLSYRFPSTISFQDFEFTNETVHIKSDSARINWHWLPLLSGQVHGDFLEAENLLIHIKETPEPEDLTDTSHFQFSDIIPISFGRIQAKNTIYRSYNAADSTVGKIPNLFATGFGIDSGIHVDSLFCGQAILSMAYLNPTDTTIDTSPYNFAYFPTITAKRLVLANNEFDLYNATQQHAFSKINFSMTDLGAKNPLDVKLNSINLIYQDTIAIAATGEELKVESSGLIVLNDVSLAMPGIDLNLKSINLQQFGEYHYAVQLNPSKINSNVFYLFSQDLPIAKNIEIKLNGGASWLGDTLLLDDFFLVADDKTSLNATGIIEIADEINNVNVEIIRFESTLFELQKLFMLPAIDGQKDVIIHSHFAAQGNVEKMSLSGQAILNKNTLNITGTLLQDASQIRRINASITSPKLVPHQILTRLSSELWFSELAVSADIDLDSATSITQFVGKFSSANTTYSSYQQEDLNGNLTYNPNKFSVEIRTRDRTIDIALATPNDIMNDENLNFSGHIFANIPTLTALEKTAGNLHTQLTGRVELTNSKTALYLHSDSLTFNPTRAHKTYSSTIDFSFIDDKKTGLQLNLKSDSTTLLFVQGDTKTMAWLGSNNKQTSNIPTIFAQANLAMDTTLMMALFATNAAFDIEYLAAKINRDSIDFDMKTKYISFEDYRATRVSLTAHYDSLNYRGSLNIDTISTPFTIADNFNFNVKPDQKNRVLADFYVHFLEQDRAIDFGFYLENKDEGLTVKFEDGRNIKIGSQNWSVIKNGGIVIKQNEETITSDFLVKYNTQEVAIKSTKTDIETTISNLELNPIASLFVKDSLIQGQANLAARYNYQTQNTVFSGGISALSVDSITIGNLTLEGKYAEDDLQLKSDLTNKESALNLAVSKQKGPFMFSVDLTKFSLLEVSPLISLADLDLDLKGELTGHVKGSFDEELTANGFLRLANTVVEWKEYGLYVAVPDDTIWMKNQAFSLRDFLIKDKNNDVLKLSGNFTIQENTPINAKIITEKFELFNKKSKMGTLWGSGSISANISATGTLENLLLSGSLATLNGTNFGYHYQSNVNIDELENEIIFIDAQTRMKKVEEIENRILTKSNNLKWNIDISIGNTDAYVLLSEASNDYVRLTAKGKLQLRTGQTSMPLVYGTIKSEDGSVFYSAPVVSDLSLKIVEASVTFQGDAENPYITFRGTETFRISMQEIDATSTSSTKVPIDVVAHIENAQMENLNLKFDLSSDNSNVGNFIENLPQDTREIYAMNLLIFGSIDGGSNAGNTVMNTLVGKLNEISRRNLPKTDLSFYIDSDEGTNENQGSDINKVGYNFSQGLFNKRVRLTVGGEVTTGTAVEASQKQFNPLSTIEVDYILKEDPEITLVASKLDSYKGAIDGQVDEYSIGITYVISFKNLFFKNEANNKK